MTLLVALQWTGTFFSALVPSRRGPRHCGQFSARATVVNARTMQNHFTTSSNKRADVFANPALHFDIKAGLCGDIECGLGAVILRGVLTVKPHGAIPSDDFHPLRFVGAEMKFTRVNQAEG